MSKDRDYGLTRLVRRTGLSISAVADKTGVSRPLLQAYLSGTRTPSARQVGRLQEAVGRLVQPPSRLLEIRKKAVLDLLAGSGVDHAAVFGSIARGTDRADSDIDIVVRFNTGGTHYCDCDKLAANLEELLGVRCDVVSLNDSPTFVGRLAAEGALASL